VRGNGCRFCRSVTEDLRSRFVYFQVVADSDRTLTGRGGCMGEMAEGEGFLFVCKLKKT
jgi:hypothetical protein